MKENKYSSWYFRLIEAAKASNRSKNSSYEEHHILPKSIGGSNDPSNLVLLTLREHFIAHRLLVKMTDGSDNFKMVHALAMMAASRGASIISSRTYASIKKLHSESRKNYRYSDEAKKKMSIAAKQRQPKSEATLQKHRDNHAHYWKGKKFSTEHRAKLSSALKGRKRSEESIKKQIETMKKNRA